MKTLERMESGAAVGISPQPKLRRYGIIAGVGYILLFALAIFANFVVREGMVVAGDAAQTAANIAESEGMFRLGTLAFLAIFVIDVVVAWALYVLFKKVDQNVSLVSAWFRIVYTVMLGVALIFFLQALQLLSGAEFLQVFDQGQIEAQALLAVESFNFTWMIGLFAFGIHLVLMGWLLFRSGWGPKVLAYFLAIAGVAYVVDTSANIMLSNYADYSDVFLMMVMIPSVIAEGWMGLWLLIRGGKQAA